MGIYYCPPVNSEEALEYLNKSLMTFCHLVICLFCCVVISIAPNIHLVFVVPTSSTRPAEPLCAIIVDNLLTLLVDYLTPVCNILDLVLTNIDCASLVNVTDNLPSTDHSAIELSLSVAIPIRSCCQKTLYNYKTANFNAFCEVLSLIPLEYCQ